MYALQSRGIPIDDVIEELEGKTPKNEAETESEYENIIQKSIRGHQDRPDAIPTLDFKKLDRSTSRSDSSNS